MDTSTATAAKFKTVTVPLVDLDGSPLSSFERRHLSGRERRGQGLSHFFLLTVGTMKQDKKIRSVKSESIFDTPVLPLLDLIANFA